MNGPTFTDRFLPALLEYLMRDGLAENPVREDILDVFDQFSRDDCCFTYEEFLDTSVRRYRHVRES